MARVSRRFTILKLSKKCIQAPVSQSSLEGLFYNPEQFITQARQIIVKQETKEAMLRELFRTTHLKTSSRNLINRALNILNSN